MINQKSIIFQREIVFSFFLLNKTIIFNTYILERKRFSL